MEHGSTHRSSPPAPLSFRYSDGHILLCTHPRCRGSKRDASTDHPRRLHGSMQQYNVDFIGADFNKSAFSTVGDVFSDTEFSAPGNSFLWGARWRSRIVIALGFSSCQSVHVSGVWIHTATTNYDNATLGLGPRHQTAHLPVFLHLRTTNLPGPNSIMRSEQAQQKKV